MDLYRNFEGQNHVTSKGFFVMRAKLQGEKMLTHFSDILSLEIFFIPGAPKKAAFTNV